MVMTMMMMIMLMMTMLPYFGKRKQVTNFLLLTFLVKEQNVCVISVDVSGISCLTYYYSRMSVYKIWPAWKKSTVGKI